MKGRSLCLISWLETDIGTPDKTGKYNSTKPAHMDGNCETSLPTWLETVEESFSSTVERRHFDDDDMGANPIMIPMKQMPGRITFMKRTR
jgi:hypothetical protein